MILYSALVLAAVPPVGGNGIQDFLAGPLGTFMFFGGMIAIFYLLVLRPQQVRAREHANQINAVKRGDTVVLSSGIIGKVVRVEEKEIGIEIAQNVTVKAVKAMVAEVRTRGEPAANDSKP
jgi:preprotein translocase subunit YajC